VRIKTSKKVEQQIFKGFSEELKRIILESSKLMRFEKGDIVLDLGQPVLGLPYVKSGLLKVYKEDQDDNEFFMYYLSPNEVCSMGLKCCLEHGKSMARVYAEEDSEMLFIPSETVQKLSSNTEWNQYVIDSLVQRIDELTEVANELAFKKLDDRIIDYLEKLSELKHTKELAITHREISKDLNSSREVISRVLKRLEKEGALSQSRSSITLL
jgi:CRP/FNR family transcriptional regulator, anaerobic regulatory protein